MENRDGAKCKFGHHAAGHTAGDVISLRPCEVYYCGRRGDYCRCQGQRCPQFCGPKNGCPCLPCLELTDRHGRLTNLCLNSDGNLSKVANDGKYYCQKYFESKSGFGTSTRVCRATTATQCSPCAELLLEPVMNFKRNLSGFCSKKALNGYFYCGRDILTAGRSNKCGPNNGSPCESCLELCVVDTPTVKPSTSRGLPQGQSKNLQTQMTTAPQQGQVDDSKLCIICLVEEKNCIVLPCAHYAYCEECVEALDDCAICRGDITEYKKVFEP